MTHIQELAIFAERHGVPVADAFVLPALFERVAERIAMPVRALIAQATYTNMPLGEYLAKAAGRAAAAYKEG